MTPQLEAIRSDRAVIASVIAAAVAVILFCLVGIAVMLGWAGGRGGGATPASLASPGQQVAGTGPEVDLVAGETLVTPAPAAAPPAKVEPMMPPYGNPAVPKAAPPRRAERPAAKPAPSLPRYVRTEPLAAGPADELPRTAGCTSCGSVTSITSLSDFWEVRVRFDDGASRRLRFPTAPGYRIGDRVRLENGRLERE